MRGTDHDRASGFRNRVLFVSMSGWLAGPGRSLASLLEHLPSDLVPVLACPTRGDLLAAIRSQTLAEHIALKRGRSQEPDPLARARAAIALARWIYRHRNQVRAIHANGFSELHLSAIGAIVARVPMVVWLHGHRVDPWDRRLGRVWRRSLPSLHVVAVSDVARDIGVAAGLASSVDQIELVPNPIDPRACLADRDRMDRTSVVAGYLAGTRKDKGFEVLPEIVSRVANPAVRWALFCDRPNNGSASAAARRLEAIGSVSWLGWKSDVREAYAQCDVILCPSLYESFNRIAAEAMLNGLPLIASDIPAHRALVGSSHAGLLFPLDDPGRAGELIERLAADGDLRREMGEAGRRAAAIFPGPDLIAKRFVDSYRSANMIRLRAILGKV